MSFAYMARGASILILAGLAVPGEAAERGVRAELLAQVTPQMRAGCLARLNGQPRPPMPADNGPVGIARAHAVSGWMICDHGAAWIAGGRASPADLAPSVSCIGTVTKLGAHVFCN